jgi:hypothetical protein
VDDAEHLKRELEERAKAFLLEEEAERPFLFRAGAPFADAAVSTLTVTLIK